MQRANCEEDTTHGKEVIQHGHDAFAQDESGSQQVLGRLRLGGTRMPE